MPGMALLTLKISTLLSMGTAYIVKGENRQASREAISPGAEGPRLLTAGQSPGAVGARNRNLAFQHVFDEALERLTSSTRSGDKPRFKIGLEV
jgi:hypothetical protein